MAEFGQGFEDGDPVETRFRRRFQRNRTPLLPLPATQMTFGQRPPNQQSGRPNFTSGGGGRANFTSGGPLRQGPSQSPFGFGGFQNNGNSGAFPQEGEGQGQQGFQGFDASNPRIQALLQAFLGLQGGFGTPGGGNQRFPGFPNQPGLQGPQRGSGGPGPQPGGPLGNDMRSGIDPGALQSFFQLSPQQRLSDPRAFMAAAQALQLNQNTVNSATGGLDDVIALFDNIDLSDRTANQALLETLARLRPDRFDGSAGANVDRFRRLEGVAPGGGIFNPDGSRRANDNSGSAPPFAGLGGGENDDFGGGLGGFGGGGGGGGGGGAPAALGDIGQLLGSLGAGGGGFGGGGAGFGAGGSAVAGLPGFGALRGIISNGGVNPNILSSVQRGLRENLEGDRQAAIESLQGNLAGRRLTGGGLEARETGRVFETLGAESSQRLRDVANAMALQGGSNSLAAAQTLGNLGVATRGQDVQLFQSQLANQLGQMQNQTTRDLGFGGLALQNLGLNTDFALGLMRARIGIGDFGLAVQQASQGNVNNLIQMLSDAAEQLRRGANAGTG